MDHPIVLITGALTGIGRATAVAFAKEEARVVVSGRHEEAGQTLAAELRALGTEAVFLLADPVVVNARGADVAHAGGADVAAAVGLRRADGRQLARHV